MRFGSGLWACGVLAILALLPAPAATAGEATLAWSTYLRAGPGETFAALDELSHDVRVSVLGCGPRWCRITSDQWQGYVDRDALTLPGTPGPRRDAASDCFVAGLADDRRPAPTRFCPSSPRPR